MELLDQNKEALNAVSFLLGTENIDLTAYQVLRNMTRRLTRNSVWVRRLIVSNLDQPRAQPAELPEPTEQNEQQIYPKVASELALRVIREASDFSKSRRCLVTMRQPPEDQEVAALRNWIQAWYALLQAGGFMPPIAAPDEEDSVPGVVTQFDEITFEITVDRFLSSECAWNVLINMLDCFGRNSHPILEMLID